jgi:hypothetical protein
MLSKVDKGLGNYLKSCCRLSSSPRSDVFSSSSPDERSTTLLFRLGGVRVLTLSLALRPAWRGSCRCFVRRSRSSSSVAESSPPRSELSSTLCRGGDRALFSLEPDRRGILRRGVRQGRKASPRSRTCKMNQESSQQLQLTAIECEGETQLRGTQLSCSLDNSEAIALYTQGHSQVRLHTYKRESSGRNAGRERMN